MVGPNWGFRGSPSNGHDAAFPLDGLDLRPVLTGTATAPPRDTLLLESDPYVTFWLNFHHFDCFELDLRKHSHVRDHSHVRGAAFSCPR